MVDHTPEFAPIVERAIAAFSGLINLYEQDAPNDEYFNKSLGEARSHRRELQRRLTNPQYLADVFRDNFFLSIYHFLENHREEYGLHMPKPDPVKAQEADHYLKELYAVMKEIGNLQRAIELGV